MKAIDHSQSGKFFCTKSCQTLWRNQIYVGENSANWKNGEKAYRSILLRSNQNQACVLCKIDDLRILTAHYLVHHDKELDQKVMEALV